MERIPFARFTGNLDTVRAIPAPARSDVIARSSSALVPFFFELLPIAPTQNFPVSNHASPTLLSLRRSAVIKSNTARFLNVVNLAAKKISPRYTASPATSVSTVA